MQFETYFMYLDERPRIKLERKKDIRRIKCQLQFSTSGTGSEIIHHQELLRAMRIMQV
jgi:hypothetical protein